MPSTSSCSMTRRTSVIMGKGYLLLTAKSSFLKVYCEIISQRLSLLRRVCTSSLATASAEERRENIRETATSTENIAEVPIYILISAAGAAHTVYACKAILVISSLFLWVGKYFVGFTGLLESLFRVLVIWMSIRMVGHSYFSISLLYLIICGTFVDAQYFIIISLCHNTSYITQKAAWNPCCLECL